MARGRKSGPTSTRQSRTSSQSTLAFHGPSNKVTKPSNLAPSNKTKKDPALLEPEASLPVKAPTEPDLDEPTTTEVSIIEQAQAEAAAALTPEEEEALEVPESQILDYWREKERERKAPRVHQEDIPLFERVCREWDTDGRFGPCTGIARIKRWKRAQKLGLNPPIEILAILLKEQEEGSVKAQTSHIDELMNSRFV